MLKTRVMTSIVLFGSLLVLLFSGYHFAFEIVLTLFFAVASWESFRLFGNAYPMWSAVLWAASFPIVIYVADFSKLFWLLAVCVGIWLFRFAPTMKLGLPDFGSVANRLLMALYSVALLAFFISVYALYRHSPMFLLSSRTLMTEKPLNFPL